jgi:hypothetical protein
VLVLSLSLGLAAAFLTRGAGPLLPSVSPTSKTDPPRATPTAEPRGAAVTLDRDPFRYLDPPKPAALDLETRPAASPPPVAEATPAPLRLVGLIRQGGRLQAALSIHGFAVTAAAGDVVEGYQVVSIDEDAGVLLRDAAGVEVTLPPG